MARLRDEEKYVARGGMTRAEVVDAVVRMDRLTIRKGVPS